MLPEPLTRHLTDEELLLDFYDEGTAVDRTPVRTHLAQCEDCRALEQELRAVLTAVDTTPITEPPNGFEREMWARIEPLLPVQQIWRTRWQGMMPRLAVAASIGLLVSAAFVAGRVWDRPATSRVERSPSPAARSWRWGRSRSWPPASPTPR